MVCGRLRMPWLWKVRDIPFREGRVSWNSSRKLVELPPDSFSHLSWFEVPLCQGSEIPPTFQGPYQFYKWELPHMYEKYYTILLLLYMTVSTDSFVAQSTGQLLIHSQVSDMLPSLRACLFWSTFSQPVGWSYHSLLCTSQAIDIRGLC